MFKFIVGLVILVAGVAARGALLQIHTDRLGGGKPVFLTKMRMRGQGTGLFCIAQLQEQKRGVGSIPDSQDTALWLAIVPRRSFHLDTLACQSFLSQAPNKVAADFRKPSNFTLNITAEDAYLAVLVYCPGETSQPLKPQTLTLSIDLFENGSHLEWPQRWLALIHLARLVVMLHILVGWQLPYQEDAMAYGPLFLALCQLLQGGFGLLQLFYLKLVGQNFYFISDMPWFFGTCSQQILLFLAAAITIGWRWRPDTGHLADIVAPFSICYGLAQLMMRFLAAYSPETAEVDGYGQTVYGCIHSWTTLGLAVMLFVLQLLGTSRCSQHLKSKVRRLVSVAALRLLLEFGRANLEQGWLTLLLQAAQLPLTCLFIWLLLRNFLTVDIDKLSRQRLRRRLQEQSQHQQSTPHNLKQD